MDYLHAGGSKSKKPWWMSVELLTWALVVVCIIIAVLSAMWLIPQDSVRIEQFQNAHTALQAQGMAVILVQPGTIVSPDGDVGDDAFARWTNPKGMYLAKAGQRVWIGDVPIMVVAGTFYVQTSNGEVILVHTYPDIKSSNWPWVEQAIQEAIQALDNRERYGD